MTHAGFLDDVKRDGVQGWAIDPAAPDTPVSLLLTANDILVARVLADRDRPDLRDAGIGNGHHGFSVELKGLSPFERHVIAVRREIDGTHLTGSPAVIEPTADFSTDLQAQFATLLADAPDLASLRQRIAFLTEQTEKLLRRHADHLSRRDERQTRRQIKWRWQASDPPPPAPLPPRALVIDEAMPNTARDAGSNAIVSHMRALQRLGYEVNFAATDMGADPSGALEAAGIAVYHAPWHGSVEEILRRENQSFDLVYLHRLAIADRYTALVRAHQPKTRLIFSVADLHHLRIARQSRAEDRPELLALARRLQAAELRAAAAADVVVTHSSFEAALLRQQLPKANIHVVRWTVPPAATQIPFGERFGMAFIGHFPHPPNHRAARWLITDIMPAVRAANRGITCALVGSDMPASLKDGPADIDPIGHVADLATIFDRIRLTVAPLTYGAGVKGKVLASLAAGIPCVCTPIAAEGLDLPAELQNLVAADPATLAANIVRLHDDEQLNQACRTAGLAYVTEHLSDSAIDTLMRGVAAIPADWRTLDTSELNQGQVSEA